MWIEVNHVDLKYAMMLSGRLSLFKVKSHRPYKINFRCPYCGDSEKSATKCRAWLQESNKTGGLRFFCFNCGKPASFYDFLKDQDGILFKDYVAERYVEKLRDSTPEASLPEGYGDAPKFDADPLRKIKKISQLKPDHPARLYINSRQIPTNKHFLIYYAPKFKTWVNSFIPGKFEMTYPSGKPRPDEPRLILPFLDANGKMFGCAARSFDPKGLRYISIMFDENAHKIFGLSTVDWNKTYYVVEGAIDSMFLSNSIAMAGADGNTAAMQNLNNAVIVFDNEPRNKEVHKRMARAISSGLRICIWPHAIQEKDINAMVLSGIADVEAVIRENTFKGLEADLRFKQWRKT